MDHADFTNDDLRLIIELQASERGFNTGFDPIDALAEVSPDDIYLAVKRMRSTESASAEQLAAWEQKYADRPEMLGPLSGAYWIAGKKRDAARIAERASELTPSFETFYVLSKYRLGTDDLAGWVEAVEKALQYPTLGLGSTDAHIELGYHYLNANQFEIARGHAEAAAESYAYRGIRFAVSFYTIVEEWETAEAWIVRLSERYPESTWGAWYVWCLATGHGHLDQAKRSRTDRFILSARSRRKN